MLRHRIAQVIRIGLSASLSFGCAEVIDLPSPPATPTFDYAIVPGQRIGPVALGMPASQLLQALGPPENSNRMANASVNRWGSKGVSAVILDENGRVHTTTALDNRYATAGGLRVGASDLEVRSLMGRPDNVFEDVLDSYSYCYQQGIVFAFYGTKTVTWIIVRPKNSCNR